MIKKTFFGLFLLTVCATGEAIQLVQASTTVSAVQCPNRSSYYIYNQTNTQIAYDLAYEPNIFENLSLLPGEKRKIANTSSKKLVGFYVFAKNGSTECVYNIFCNNGKWDAVEALDTFNNKACHFDDVNTFTILSADGADGRR